MSPVASSVWAAAWEPGPLRPDLGQPLPVAVYHRVLTAIRDGELERGQPLPTDARLAELLDVPREVVRDGLLLLAEDGLLRTRRGVGRTVAERRVGTQVERLRGWDEALSASSCRLARTLQAAGPNLATLLGVEERAAVWVWDSVLERGDRPVGVLLEAVPADGDAAVAMLGAGDPGQGDAARSLGTLVLRALGPQEGTARCRVGAGTAGEHRARRLGVTAQHPVLVLQREVVDTTTGAVVLHDKCVLLPDAVDLSVLQGR